MCRSDGPVLFAIISLVEKLQVLNSFEYGKTKAQTQNDERVCNKSMQLTIEQRIKNAKTTVVHSSLRSREENGPGKMVPFPSVEVGGQPQVKELVAMLEWPV